MHCVCIKGITYRCHPAAEVLLTRQQFWFSWFVVYQKRKVCSTAAFKLRSWISLRRVLNIVLSSRRNSDHASGRDCVKSKDTKIYQANVKCCQLELKWRQMLRASLGLQGETCLTFLCPHSTVTLTLLHSWLQSLSISDTCPNGQELAAVHFLRQFPFFSSLGMTFFPPFPTLALGHGRQDEKGHLRCDVIIDSLETCTYASSISVCLRVPITFFATKCLIFLSCSVIPLLVTHASLWPKDSQEIFVLLSSSTLIISIFISRVIPGFLHFRVLTINSGREGGKRTPDFQ